MIEEELRKIKEKFKLKEDEILSVKKQLGEVDYEFKQQKNRYLQLEGKYIELKTLWDNISKTFGKGAK